MEKAVETSDSKEDDRQSALVTLEAKAAHDAGGYRPPYDNHFHPPLQQKGGLPWGRGLQTDVVYLS